jgi:hypothetical protein
LTKLFVKSRGECTDAGLFLNENALSLNRFVIKLLRRLLILLDPLHQRENLFFDETFFLVGHLYFEQMRLIFLIRLELHQASSQFSDVRFMNFQVALAISPVLVERV